MYEVLTPRVAVQKVKRTPKLWRKKRRTKKEKTSLKKETPVVYGGGNCVRDIGQMGAVREKTVREKTVREDTFLWRKARSIVQMLWAGRMRVTYGPYGCSERRHFPVEEESEVDRPDALGGNALA